MRRSEKKDAFQDVQLPVGGGVSTLGDALGKFCADETLDGADKHPATPRNPDRVATSEGGRASAPERVSAVLRTC